jgi:hypothetical protein
MTGCCNARGCDELFGARTARYVAKRYRKKGLDRTARRMVAFLESRGLDDARVLEIGGGVGEIGIELLKRGAAGAVNLELSPAYEPEAKRLLRDEGLEERAEFRLHDIAADPEAVSPADVVVLHRVVCCYPDHRRLLGAAAGHARRCVVFSYPPRHALSRLLVGAQNVVFWLLGKDFRAYAHPPEEMLGVLEKRGLRRVFAHRAAVWQIAGCARE